MRVRVHARDEVRRVAGPRDECGRAARAGQIHVAQLAAGTRLLAVHVDLDGRIVREHVEVRVIEVCVVRAQHVHHRGERGQRRGIAQRQVEDRAQVLLELARDGPVLRPVAGVVRAHRQLVDEVPVVDLEHLHRHDAGDAQAGGERDDVALDALGQLRRQIRGRCDGLLADAVLLHRRDDRPDGGLARRGAAHHDRQFALEVDLLLCQQRSGRVCEPVCGLGGVMDDADAVAVVAAARGLEDERQAQPARGLLELLDGGHLRPARVGQAQLVDLPAHDQLVLRVDERVRAGVHAVACGLECAQVLRRHVLVVEGEDVYRLREGEQGVPVLVVAHGHVCGHLCGGGPLRLTEDMEGDAQRLGCGCHHPSQLSAAHDTDLGESHGVQCMRAEQGAVRRPVSWRAWVW